MDLEFVAVWAVLCAVLLPIAFFAQDAPLRLAGLAGWALASVALLAGAAPYRGATVRPVPTNRPIELPQGDYVSSDACRACHPGEYDSWYHSWHRTMTQVVTPDSVIGDFDADTLRVDSWTYEVGRTGDDYWVEFYDLARTERVRKPIVMSTGSHHMQIYWFSMKDSDRSLGMFPFVYLKDEARWVPRNAIFIAPPVTGPPAPEHYRWNRDCLFCHTTDPRPRITEHGVYSQVNEFGIACEACHGPGGPHVRANARDVGRRYQLHLGEEPDDTIVHPKRLSKQRSAELCGNCHGVTQMLDSPAEYDRMLLNGFRYRPGDLIEESGRVVIRGGDNASEPRIAEAIERYALQLDTLFWSDGMVRVPREYNGLLESPCYRQSEMTCLTCHAMHKSADDPRSYPEWADDQLAVGMGGDAPCLDCHADFRTEEHTRHPLESEGSRCQNCHMPYTSYALLKAIRQHEIDVPRVAATVETGRPNACNACHLDRSLSWAASWLEDWYGQARPQLDADEEQTAAGALWMLRGDAALRALAAWYAGWEPARESAGEDWLVPVLAKLLEDPYVAVRNIAWRSLRELPGFESLEYDYLAPEEERAESRRAAWRRWNSMRRLPGERAESLLLYPDGAIDRRSLARLLEQRDDRPVAIAE